VRVRFLNVLLLAAVALALSRLWLFLGEPAPSLPSAPAEEATAAAEPQQEKPAEPAQPRPEEYDVIVARDLFSPTRGVVPPAPLAAPKALPKPLAAPKLTLYGVVIVDGAKAAFLQEGSQEGRPRKVRENESFAGGVLKAIRPDGVTFVFGGNEISVPLRTPKPGAGSAGSGRDQETGGAAPQPGTPMALPRRQMPAVLPQMPMPTPGGQMPTGFPQMPIPTQGRQMPQPPQIGPPGEPGSAAFGNEEFPEAPLPGEEFQEPIPEEMGE
jgi:hypothetical protein